MAAAKVVIVQTGNNCGDDDDGGDLYFALSNYEHEDEYRSDNVTAKNKDGNDLSLVYSKCDDSGCDELDDDKLAGLKIDLDVLSEEEPIADVDHSIFVKLASVSPTPLAAVEPSIIPVVTSEEPVEDNTGMNTGLAPEDTSLLPSSDAPEVDKNLGKFELTDTIGTLAPEEPSICSNNTQVKDYGIVKSETMVASKPLGSLWTFDDCYPNTELGHHSCHLASRPWPNYCM